MKLMVPSSRMPGALRNTLGFAPCTLYSTHPMVEMSGFESEGSDISNRPESCMSKLFMNPESFRIFPDSPLRLQFPDFITTTPSMFSNLTSISGVTMSTPGMGMAMNLSRYVFAESFLIFALSQVDSTMYSVSLRNCATKLLSFVGSRMSIFIELPNFSISSLLIISLLCVYALVSRGLTNAIARVHCSTTRQSNSRDNMDKTSICSSGKGGERFPWGSTFTRGCGGCLVAQLQGRAGAV
mmetsp:Transcript_23895/g.53710  ORF Transcript_23895/g.53710 Transcript_23895/m.53710 type:complete len:240 (+) Transcript_23895:136-855(+)